MIFVPEMVEKGCPEEYKYVPRTLLRDRHCNGSSNKIKSGGGSRREESETDLDDT